MVAIKGIKPCSPHYTVVTLSGLEMDRRSNKSETDVEHTRVRYPASPPHIYQQGVSQPNEISVELLITVP